MMTTFIFLLFFSSLSAHAGAIFKATQLIDHGDYTEVIHPYIRGCANDLCYGGPGDYMLRPTFSGNKICKGLGLDRYIRGSKATAVIKVGMVYAPFVYHILERSGPPGQPMPEQRNVIVSLECSK